MARNRVPYLFTAARNLLAVHGLEARATKAPYAGYWYWTIDRVSGMRAVAQAGTKFTLKDWIKLIKQLE